LADTTAVISYLADLAVEFGASFADEYPGFEGRRLHLKTAMAAIRAYEHPLAARLIEGLSAISSITTVHPGAASEPWGPTFPREIAGRWHRPFVLNVDV
jgi:selenocysteine lyase/cysteine desulfurase